MTIASFAPMTCMPALVQSDLDCVARAVRENVEGQTRHWLFKYTDRPADVNLKVSAFALAAQITRMKGAKQRKWQAVKEVKAQLRKDREARELFWGESEGAASDDSGELGDDPQQDSGAEGQDSASSWGRRGVPSQGSLDADGIYGLLLLRSFNTSWDVLTWEELQCDSEDVVASDPVYNEKDLSVTPLCSAISVHAATVVRLLLVYRADPNGFQTIERDSEGEPYQRATPLSLAISLCQPHLVQLLLEARADANQWGLEMDVRGLGHDSVAGAHINYETPLWQAVHLACECTDRSPRGLARRAIMRFLLSHRARPDVIGKIEYFVFPCGSDPVLDPDGHLNATHSRTTPLQVALKRRAGLMNGIWWAKHAAPPSWSIDVVDILRGG